MRGRVVAAAVVAGLLATGCGTGGGTARATAASTVGRLPKATGYITVLAADPIAPTVRRAAQAFRTANPIASVTIESAPSAALVAQVRQGRAADLLVAAGTADMDAIVRDELVLGAPTPIARRSEAGTRVVYPVALLTATNDQVTARAFLRFLQSPAAASLIEDGGFRPES